MLAILTTVFFLLDVYCLVCLSFFYIRFWNFYTGVYCVLSLYSRVLSLETQFPLYKYDACLLANFSYVFNIHLNSSTAYLNMSWWMITIFFFNHYFADHLLTALSTLRVCGVEWNGMPIGEQSQISRQHLR